MTIQTLKHPAFVLSLMAPLMLGGCASGGKMSRIPGAGLRLAVRGSG